MADSGTRPDDPLLDDEIVPSPSVSATRVGEETVLLHLSRGMYFGLDPIGTRIWEGIEAGRSLRQVCDALVAEFGITQETARADAAAFVADLLAQDIIERPAPDA